MAEGKFYSVRKGKSIGIFKTWSECQESVKGYPGAEYKSFNNIEQAQLYLNNKIRKVENTIPENLDNISNDEMIAYVDGSYDSNLACYSYGAIIFLKGEKKELSGRGNDEDLAKMRNVAGEILGAREAMAYAIDIGVKKLYLYYDYEGIEKWATLKWQANKKGTIEYKEYYDKISKDLEVVFIKVKAHSGDKYNEEADELAKKALLIESKDGKDISLTELINSKISKSSFIPTFNIITSDSTIFNTDTIITEFKRVWKNKKKYLKDIIELKILIDTSKMKAIFKIKTDKDSYDIEIELR